MGVKILHILRRSYAFAAFYVGWIICLSEGAEGKNLLSISVTALFVAIQLLMSHAVRRDVEFCIGLCLLGALMDSMWMHLGIIEYKGVLPFLPMLCPPWVICIYALLAIALNHSLRWLKAYPILAALCGGIGAVMTYKGGEGVGAAVFHGPFYLVPLLIGTIWAILFPLCLRYTKGKEEAKS